MFCTDCGSNNTDEAMFCQKCGRQLKAKDHDEFTILSVPSPASSPYSNIMDTSAGYGTSKPIYAPPPPSASSPNEVVSSKEKSTVSSSPKRKSRRGLNAIVIVILLIVIAGLSTYIYLSRSTPNITLAAYGNALKAADYQTAYNQLSTRAKTGLSESQFATIWESRGGVKSWAASNVQEQGTIATAIASFGFGNGQTSNASISLVNENGTWKIDTLNG